MAKSSPQRKELKPPEPPPQPSYPQIEGFIEQSGQGDIEALFGPLKDSLLALKGPRTDQAKKATKAVQRTEELLAHLLEVREKLRASRPEAAKGRR